MRLILYTKKSISESKIKHLASLILLLKVYYKSTIKVDATLFLIPKNKKLSDSILKQGLYLQFTYRVHRKIFRGPSTLLVLLYTQTKP